MSSGILRLTSEAGVLNKTLCVTQAGSTSAITHRRVRMTDYETFLRGGSETARGSATSRRKATGDYPKNVTYFMTQGRNVALGVSVFTGNVRQTTVSVYVQSSLSTFV